MPKGKPIEAEQIRTSRIYPRESQRDILWATPLCYVRRPGVTPQAAAAALTRFGPAGEAPLARTFAIFVLAMTPLALLLSASIYLQGWLQFQWILR